MKIKVLQFKQHDESVLEEKKKDFLKPGCPHHHIIVDEEKWLIECNSCQERLDPIQWLIIRARRTQGLKYDINRLQEEVKKIETRLRTKCDHCGKMTRI